MQNDVVMQDMVDVLSESFIEAPSALIKMFAKQMV